MAPALIAARLPGFLGRAARTRFAYGSHDCLLWLADWVVALDQPDPAAAWRGCYATELGAARLLKRHGGHTGLLRTGLARAPDQSNQVGDIAVVEITGLENVADHAGAIRTSVGWAVLSLQGLIVSNRLRAVAVWSV